VDRGNRRHLFATIANGLRSLGTRSGGVNHFHERYGHARRYLPGPASGPFRHVHFSGTISSSSLIGNLTGRRLGQLRDQMSEGNVTAVVTTNNGVDSATTVAPGNVQTGEISGMFMKQG
jgi:hypothetical protein